VKRTLLLAWELGGGSGHVSALTKVVEHFPAGRFEFVAALKDVSAGAPLAAMGVEVLQAPIWPGSLRASSVPLEPASSSSMGDMLAGIGLAHGSVLTPIMTAWLGLITRIKPDLVIGDFAPGASLAARGLVPMGQIGTGYSLPPSHMTRFPALHRLSALRWREEQLVATVNGVLLEFSKPPIEYLPQIFEADVTYVYTFPALDPYRAERLRPADGPAIDRLPHLRKPDAETIFVYLSPGVPPPQHVVTALQVHAREFHIYAPSMAAHDMNKLADAGARFFDRPQSFETELSRHRLIIHYGVAGTAAAALLAGVPQLALSLDIEKDLNGQALQELGVGRLIKIHDPAIRLTADDIGLMAEDKALAKRAEDVAHDTRENFNPNAVRDFTDGCLRLLA
jgi:UDP:flavonoid glycosyltransferase YjiC (YdhE family)